MSVNSFSNSLLANWHTFLTDLSADRTLLEATQQAFRLEQAPQPLTELLQQWQTGNFSALPEIELLSDSAMNGVAGGYAYSNETIYLNEEWLASVSEDDAIAVLTEELGHHLAYLVGKEDAPGDEGAIFASLALGEELGDRWLSTLRGEDDRGVVTVEGKPVEVEQSAGFTRVDTNTPGTQRTEDEWQNSSAFAALKEDGSVRAWGSSESGGDLSGEGHLVQGVPGGELENVQEIFSTSGAFAALKEDGSVQTWGGALIGGSLSGVNSAVGVPGGELENVQEIFSTKTAFAALKEDGSVQAWGDLRYGGDLSGDFEYAVGVPGGELENVQEIFSTEEAFAALKEDGSVRTWGWHDSGGDLSGGTSGSGVPGGELKNVQEIFSTDDAFAALKEDGSVRAWGDFISGGDLSGEDTEGENRDYISGVPGGELKNVQEIFSTNGAFAALKEDGSVQTWGASRVGGDLSGGHEDASGVPGGELENVQEIISTRTAFAALKEDGSVQAWGNSRYGGDLSGESFAASGVPGGELENVQEIFSNGQAFAALKEDGSVQAWGGSSVGGDLSGEDRSNASGVPGGELENVQDIFSNNDSFAALKEDGSVQTWGGSGGDLNKELENVQHIFSTEFAFAALKEDGSVQTWGSSRSGGDLSGGHEDASGVPDGELENVVTLASPFVEGRIDPNENDTPQAENPIADREVTEGENFNFQIPDDAFSDPDGNDLSYSATLENSDSLPSWLSFNPADRTFSGTPGEADDGSLELQVTASDEAGATASGSFTLNVAEDSGTGEGDSIQQVSATPNPTVATAGESLSFDVNYDATDAQLTNLGLRLHYNSSQIQFDSLGNLFQDSLTAQGSPQEDIGNFDGDEATDRFINVAWADIQGQWPGEDNTPATLYTANFTPTEDFSDRTALNFTASVKASGFELEADSVAVYENEAPAVDGGIENRTAPERQAFEFPIPDAAFSDANVTNNEGDSLSFSATRADGGDLPGWLSFNAETRTFSGTPSSSDAGSWGIQVTAQDSEGAAASDTFQLTVGEGVIFSPDVDGNGEVSALSDGILTLRYMFGFRGAELTAGALGQGATRTEAAVADYLGKASQALDVDANGEVEALTDGILLVRALFGFEGESLTQGALGEGAQRTQPSAIAERVAQLRSGQAASSSALSEDLSHQIPELTANRASSKQAESPEVMSPGVAADGLQPAQQSQPDDGLTASA